MSELKRLQQITRTLREPGGCEWDRKQDYESMRRYVLEEAYELVDAIDQGNQVNLVEELGDLLFHVFFFARMGEEEGCFTIEDIARGIGDKLVRRHPHVFGDVQVDGVDQILDNWEKIKATEKAAAGASATTPSAIPENTGRELSSLMRAEKIQAKAARVGFDWQDVWPVFDKILEELTELRTEIEQSVGARPDAREPGHGPNSYRDRSRLEEELGDVLFSVVNLARHLDIEPETSLNRANRKFIRRFQQMELLAAERGLVFTNLSEEKLNHLWDEVKSRGAVLGTSARIVGTTTNPRT